MIFGGHILFSAESEGFEPPVQLPVHRISSADVYKRQSRARATDQRVR